MIPQTFNDWTNCIVNDCKINLTKDFAEKRLAVYQDNQNIETQNLFRYMANIICKTLLTDLIK
jgi:hypothetical protein